ncbi:M48 family metallopeptidase [Lysobacter antibioticus]|uniref:M48 family metallopeptidase n=1 Tax=Lysobacter antibioticus TaxID=84531 RepID=UPI0007166EF9|nr:SprT family zinc-dependent metalloprotease [Lysobacter antibioticus]
MTSLVRLLTGKPQAPPRTVSRETLAIDLGNGRVVEVLRVRDPRARRIKLSVDERGPRLTLPMRASEIAGQRFVIEHGDWLLAQIAQADSDATRLQPHVSATIPLRGAELPVRWQVARYLRLQLNEDALEIAAPEAVNATALQRALRDFYEGQARADVGRWLPKYLPGLPRAPSRLRYRVMSSQWGSLAPDGALSLDLSLVLAPPPAFEYVLVHELCHLIHADHSRAFWREVEARCPDWRDQREYFRASGRSLKAGLRRLIAADE